MTPTSPDRSDNSGAPAPAEASGLTLQPVQPLLGPLADLGTDLLQMKTGASPGVEIPLVAAGVGTRLRFVGKHAIDLQSELRTTAGEPIEDDREFVR